MESMYLGGLPKRAAFDLGCPSDKLRFRKLDDQTVGVTGCGKRGTYVKTGDTWILNGMIEASKRKSKPEPEPEPEPESESESESNSPDEP